MRHDLFGGSWFFYFKRSAAKLVRLLDVVF